MSIHVLRLCKVNNSNPNLHRADKHLLVTIKGCMVKITKGSTTIKTGEEKVRVKLTGPTI